MNLHLSHDDKFLDSFIKNSKKYTNTYNIYVVFSDTNELKYTKSKEVIIAKQSIDEVKKIFLKYPSILNIYFHALSSFYSKLVNQLSLHENFKLIWLFYGFEVFGLNQYLYKLLLKETLKVYKQDKNDNFFKFTFNPIYLRRNIIKYIHYSRIREKEESLIKELIKKIHYLGHFVKEDYDEYIHPLNPKLKFIEWNYLSDSDLEFNSSDTNLNENKFRILLGNSASFFNNHIDALSIINQKFGHIENLEILVPLNYSGSQFYIHSVINYGKMLFKDKFIPIVDFMGKKQYYDLLKSVEVAFFLNIRSQAAGNINWFLKNNKKVVMHQDSSLYKFYIRKGFKIFSIKDIDQILISKEVTFNFEINSKLMKVEFGEERMREKYVSLLKL